MWSDTLRLVACVATLGGCRPDDEFHVTEELAQQYASVRCQAVAACCAEPEPTCVEEWSSWMIAWEDLDLRLSEACFEHAVESLGALGCGGEDEVPMACPFGLGNAGRGDPCSEIYDGLILYSVECRDGLQCIDGVCVDRPLVVVEAPPGGFCGTPEWACDPEHFCSEGEICEPRVPLGSECDHSIQCLMPVDHYCASAQGEERGRCSARPELGEPCSDADACRSICEEGSCSWLVCDEGVCQQPSTTGPAICL